MTDKHVLVVMTEMPFPPRKNGLTLRYHPLLMRLSQQFRLTLAAVVGDDGEALGELNDRLENFIPLRKSAARSSLLRKVSTQLLRLSPFGIPYEYYDYGVADLVDQLRPILANNYDAVVWVTQDHLLYACLPLLKKHRLIIDAVDSISLHMIRSMKSRGLVRALRTRKMKHWEATMMDSAVTGFYISPVDLAAVQPLVRRVKLAISPNGTLIDDYIDDKAPLKSPSLGFLGNMSYGPNVDAAHRLYGVYRTLKQSVPELSLYLIGRDPDPSLQQYADDPDVYVTGTLDSIWPHVNAVDIFVMPMAMGAGQQNKLLEVMYAGKPIVASSVANGGVLAVDGESVIIADDAAATGKAVLGLLQDPARRQRIASAGASFVRETYDWDQIAERFANAVLGRA